MNRIEIFNRKIRSTIKTILFNIQITKIYSFIYSIFKNPELISKKGKLNVYLLGTTAHNNLGDHAISYAEYIYIKKFFPDYTVIEIEDKNVFKYLESIRKNILKNDIIFLHGGGNVGTEYFYHEIIRRQVIDLFPQNRIVIFPQTIDFRNNTKELNKSMHIYNNHPRLLFMIRERFSYETYGKFLNGVKTVLIPDIVLSMKRFNLFSDNKCVYLCLRNDVEAVTPDTFVDKVKRIMQNRGEEIEIIDTKNPFDFGKEQRERMLRNYWGKLSKGKLIITDRLHAMVFSYLLGVKCVVLPNYNKKVEGTYDWIKSNDRIFFFQNYEEALKAIETIDLYDAEPGDEVDFTPYFSKAAEMIRDL